MQSYNVLARSTVQGGAISYRRSCVDGDGRDPYYSRAGLTSIHGKQVCDFYDRPGTGVGTGVAGKGPTTIANQEMFETFLVRDTRRKDRAGKGIIDIYGGIKWGWRVQAAQS